MELLPKTEKKVYIVAFREALNVINNDYYKDELSVDISKLFNDTVVYEKVQFVQQVENFTKNKDYFSASVCQIRLTKEDVIDYEEAERRERNLKLKDYIARKLGINVLNVYTAYQYGHRYASEINADFIFKSKRPRYYVILTDTIKYISTADNSEPILNDRNEIKVFDTFCKDNIITALSSVGLDTIAKRATYLNPFMPNKLQLGVTGDDAFKAEVKKYIVPAIRDALGKMFDKKLISILKDYNVDIEAIINKYYTAICCVSAGMDIIIDVNFSKENKNEDRKNR